MITNLTTIEITPRPGKVTYMRAYYSSNQDEKRWWERVKEC